MRIGLGQVLTNNVLSLFVGDEIDAGREYCEHPRGVEELHLANPVDHA